MKNLLLIILIGFFLRVFAVFYLGNLHGENYWEYGEIAKNLTHNKGYSLFYIDNNTLQYRYDEKSIPEPSAYMMPGYVYILAPFMLIENIALRNILLLFTHIVISTLTIFLIYKLAEELFSKKVAVISAIITAILPEFIYANLSYTPTVLYHLLIVLLILKLYKAQESYNNILYVGIITTAIIYLRPEFILFALALAIILFFYKKYRESLGLLIIMMILIFPWVMRNYNVFNRLIPFTTSSGLNFYRGNNPDEIGDWGDLQWINNFEAKGKEDIEIKLMDTYKEKAFEYIKANPIKVIKDSLIKLFDFWVINPGDKRSLNLFYLIPSLLIFALFIIGIYLSFDIYKFRFLYLFFICSTIVIIIFFPMPRYQTMMKILMIPFSAYGIEFLHDQANKLFNLHHYNNSN